MKKNPTISVGIMLEKSIIFSLNGDYCDNQNKQIYSNQLTCRIEKGKLVIENSENTISFEKEVTLAPEDIRTNTFDLTGVTIGKKFHWEQKENQRFQGSLKLLIVNDGITAINILPLENYLASVISSEMSANSSIELLKAHAVISRSWLMAQINKHHKITHSDYQSTHTHKDEFIRWYDREDHTHFDVCADDHCQRYQGITKAHHPNVVTAVKDTHGMILMSDGEICDARFSKCCGGMTERFENCWEPKEHPYLKKIADRSPEPPQKSIDLTQEADAENWIQSRPTAFCNTTDESILSEVLNQYDRSSKDYYRWKVSYTQEQISELIRKKSGMDFGKIKDLLPIERGTSARLIKLKIVGVKKSLTIGKELEIRKWLSESHLYSSAFTIQKKDIENEIPGQFIIKGAGWGHGVGLCQIGAAVMGQMNYTYTDILNHYFIGAVLEKKYD